MQRTRAARSISAKGSSNATSKRRFPTNRRKRFCIAAAAIDRRWPPTFCRTWVTRMYGRWPAAGRRGRNQARQLLRVERLLNNFSLSVFVKLSHPNLFDVPRLINQQESRRGGNVNAS